jgi:drug/metabolite transporter (DMT)-like permease
MPTTADRVPGRVVVVLGVALVAVSTSAVLVRLLGAVDPVAVAFWRTLGAALLLSPALRRTSPRDVARILLAGAFLAGHFGAWFASLQHTSVMRSTLLVASIPVWVGVMEGGLLGERPGRSFWIGLAVAAPGVALIAVGSHGGPGGLYGDGLALVGAIFGAGYLLLGRSVRSRVGIGTYACLVCAAAALVLGAAAVVGSVPLTGLAAGDWVLIGLLAAGPQLLGHNGFNYALRYVSAATVSSVLLLEPVGATMLGVLLLNEVPRPVAIAGGALVVLGVVMANRARGSALGRRYPGETAQQDA